jgi:hypothetical protein
MIEELRRDPAMPIYWGSNKPGMQAGDEVDSIHNVTSDWLDCMEEAIVYAQRLIASGLHKQIANRILEPWAHINVVVTATDYANFYMLRRHKDAQPEMKALADAMWDAQQLSVPHELQVHEWHLPYVHIEDYLTLRIEPGTLWQDEPDSVEILRKISVARCARVSYLTHDGRRTSVKEDLELHDKLMVGQPLHASPAEHQATPDRTSDYGRMSYEGDKETVMEDPANGWDRPELHGNFTGWIQYRKTLEGEFLPG